MSSKTSKEIVVKRANVSDAIGIAPLCAQLGYPCASEDVARRLSELIDDEDHAVFVALNSEGTVVGWVHSYVYKLLYADKSAAIGGIVVDENFRRYGVGQKLMKAVEEWAKSKACEAVSLKSNCKRVEAHKFYNAIGYQKTKEQYAFIKPL